MLQWWENLTRTTWEQPWLNLSGYLAWRSCPSWRKDQIPCVTALALPDTWHTGFTGVEAKLHSLQNRDADKIPDKLKDMKDSRLLCAGSRPWKILPSAPSFPAAAEPAWLLRSQHKLLLQFSAQRSSNPTFLQVPPFKTKRTHHYSSSSKLATGECPATQRQPHDLLLRFGTGVCKHIWCCDSFLPIPLPFLFPAPLFSLTSLFWLSHGRKTNWNMLQSWNYSSLHGFEIKQNIDFPKNFQWMLK